VVVFKILEMQVVSTIPKLKPRAVDAHKGDFGKVCIIAGSVGMSGAAALAGRSALRAGRLRPLSVVLGGACAALPLVAALV